MQIEWVVVDELGTWGSLGHGVVFFHDDISPEIHGQPTAFLDGYGWLHDGQAAVVRLLHPGSIPAPASTEDLQRIIHETQIAVLTFLLDGSRMVGQNSPRVTDSVWAHING